MSAWIGIIGTIFGALLAGILSWFNPRFQLRYKEARDRKRFFLNNLEEIYEVLVQFKHLYTMLTLDQITTLVARQPFQKSEGPPVPIERLQMLVGFYAPELSPQLEQLLNSRKEYSQSLVERVGLETKGETAIKNFIGDSWVREGGLTQAYDQMQE